MQTPMLLLLREMLSGSSSGPASAAGPTAGPSNRFQPYLDVMPARGSVINACNMDYEAHKHLIQSAEYWVS